MVPESSYIAYMSWGDWNTMVTSHQQFIHIKAAAMVNTNHHRFCCQNVSEWLGHEWWVAICKLSYIYTTAHIPRLRPVEKGQN